MFRRSDWVVKGGKKRFKEVKMSEKRAIRRRDEKRKEGVKRGGKRLK